MLRANSGILQNQLEKHILFTQGRGIEKKLKEKVHDSVSKDMIGKKITLIGLAVDCKAGPCLKLKNNIVYIQELEYWDSEFIGKKISVTGTLLKKKIIPDPEIDESGAMSTGAYGEQLVLENISQIRKV